MLKARWFGFLLLIGSWCMAQQEYPKLTEFVTDKAQIFTQPQLEGLRTKLYQFESETTNQLVILTIDELGNETIEQYALEVFNQNGLGQEGKDNGILILFSKLDREVRDVLFEIVKNKSEFLRIFSGKFKLQKLN